MSESLRMVEYRGYNLETEPWQEPFFNGFVCWILWGCGTVSKRLGQTSAEAAQKAKALIDHWKAA